MTLVHWTYTNEEWKAFLRSSKKKNNIFYRVVQYLFIQTVKSAPQVSITPEKVCVGNDQQYFSSSKHELRQIDLRHEKVINILAITYERGGSNHEIRIPVPKGKLREAIEVQDRLMPNY